MTVVRGVVSGRIGRSSTSRRALEEAYRRLSLEALKREAAARGSFRASSWLRQYENDPNGFIREVLGPVWDTPTWKPWRTFISAVFALPFEDDEAFALYQRCTNRNHPPTQPFKEVWAPVGRRGGKSRVFALLAVWMAVCHDWSKYLVPGEEGMIPVIADARDRALQTMGYVKAALSHPKLKDMVVSDLSEEVHLKNNVIIRVATASIKAARSRTVLSALCDEIAFWVSDELKANPDKEIIRALRPAMLTIPISRLFCLSSPYARRGMLWEQYRNYFGRDDPRVLVWQGDTQTMHPTVDMFEIDRAYKDDPTAASAEYGALFRTDVETILTLEIVESCVITGRYELAPMPRTVYKAFVDPSGGSSDSMTLAIAHFDTETERTVLDLVREVKPPFSPEAVVQDFAATIRQYGLVSVRGDRYAGEWPRERFALHGVSYEISERSRSELYQAVIPLFNSRKVELLDDRTLINQFVGLERRTRASARDLIDHAPGGHDDVANSVAGAITEVAYAGGEIWSRPWTFTPTTGPSTGSAVLYAQQAQQRGRFMR